jgi:hypothetical protein
VALLGLDLVRAKLDRHLLRGESDIRNDFLDAGSVRACGSA